MPTENVWLTSTLKELLHEPAVADAEKNAIAELLMESIEKLIEFGENKTPANLAADIHTGVDRLINVRQKNSESESEKITCWKGCAHCCSQIVACSGIEAVLLAQVAREQGLALDMTKLERQSGRNDATWLEQPPEDRTCVFLGPDQLCQVYEHRPASCRKYFSISDPSACDLIANPGGQTQVWFAVHAEILTSAMFTACTTGFLPDLLLTELRREP